jgi:hypothetical protein
MGKTSYELGVVHDHKFYKEEDLSVGDVFTSPGLKDWYVCTSRGSVMSAFNLSSYTTVISDTLLEASKESSKQRLLIATRIRIEIEY